MKITAKQLIDEARKLAAESPDNVYGKYKGSCYYDEGICTNGSVGCLFGQALAKLDALHYVNSDSSYITQVLENKHIEISHTEHMWLTEVQSAQDSLKHWGQCILEADKLIAESY